MEYEIKLIAYLDILGFGQLVMSSANDPKLTNTIYEVLSSIDKTKVNQEAFIQLSPSVPQEEMKSAKEVQALMAQAMSLEWPIVVSYFSDSLVLSASDSNACYLILELIAQLNVRIWEEYRLLLRGGIAIDKLIHVDNGPIYGPAMNCAYHLESKKAINPRVVLEPTAFQSLKKVDLYTKMRHLFSDSEDFVNINLASSYNHLINFSTLSLHPEYKEKLIASLNASPEALEGKIAEFLHDKKVQSKYIWIKGEIDSLIQKTSS